MIPLPKVPTQNLYKFAAIGGIALIGGFGFLSAHASIELTKITHDANQVCVAVKEREEEVCEQACDLGINWSDLQSHSESHFKDPEKKDVLRRWGEIRLDWKKMIFEAQYVDWLGHTYIVISLEFCAGSRSVSGPPSGASATGTTESKSTRMRRQPR